MCQDHMSNNLNKNLTLKKSFTIIQNNSQDEICRFRSLLCINYFINLIVTYKTADNHSGAIDKTECHIHYS